MGIYNTITLSIGRNINNKAMEAGEWYLFRRQARAILEQAGGHIVADTTGAGVYDGVEEESAVFIALNVNNIEEARDRIAQLLSAYNQEAAGFTIDLMPELLYSARAMV